MSTTHVDHLDSTRLRNSFVGWSSLNEAMSRTLGRIRLFNGLTIGVGSQHPTVPTNEKMLNPYSWANYPLDQFTMRMCSPRLRDAVILHDVPLLINTAVPMS